jgi:hypothetical protein
MFSPHCCGFYSFTGMVFMSFVYAILSTQPFLVSGIDEPDEARENALGALITFAALFGVCVFLIHRNKNVEGGREYDSAPDNYNRLNIDLKKVYGEQKVYGSVATDSY